MKHTIALAVDSIIYAPLFIAAQAGYFDPLEVHFRVINWNFATKHQKRHDLFGTRTFWHLWESAPAPPLITICDPMHALLFIANKRVNAKIIGILLAQPACWLFDGANEKELLNGNPFRQHNRLVTYPKGMTGDTIAKSFLSHRGISVKKIKNVKPENLLIGFDSDNCTDIVVSAELFDMYRVADQKAGDYRICHDFAKDDTLRNYLMTGIVTTDLALRRYRSEVKQVLNGLNVALQMIQHDRDHAWKQLRRYYQYRYSEFTHTDTTLATAPLSALPRLTGNWQSDEQILHRAFNNLVSVTERYPYDVRLEDLHKRLNDTWDVFKQVQRRSLETELKSNLAEIDKDVAKQINEQDLELNPRDVMSYLLHLRKESEEKILGFSDMSPQTDRLARWVNSLNGELHIYRYKLLGSYLRLDEEARRVIEEVHKKILSYLDAFLLQKSPRKPLVFFIGGASTCGKTTFVKEIQQILADRGLLITETINIKMMDDSKTLKGRLVERLRPLNMDPSSWGVMFIDEINKRMSAGALAFGDLIPFLRPDDKAALKVSNKIIWFLAGTLRGNLTEVKDKIMSMDSDTGEDFVNRLTDGFEIPSANSPEELAFMSLVPLLNFTYRPNRVETAVLVYCGVQTDLATVADKVPLAAARAEKRNDGFLRLSDLISDPELISFQETYRRVLGGLPEIVKIFWAPA